MINIQVPTNQIQGEGTEGVKANVVSYRSRLDKKPCFSLNPRFGQEEKHLPGQARTIEPSVLRCPPAACMYSHPDTCLSTKLFRHPRSCGSQRPGLKAEKEFCVEHHICNAVAGISLSCSFHSFP